MLPNPAAPCDRCQKLSTRVSLRNLPPPFSRSQMVLPSMRLVHSLWNRSRAASLRAQLPSKAPQIAAHTRNQQVDEQALSSLKKLGFQSADESRAGKRPQDFCMVGRPLLWAPAAVTDDYAPARQSMRRIRRSNGCGHGFQHSTEIAVGREDRRRVLFKGGAHHIKAAQKRIEFLRFRRAERCGVNRRGFGVGFAFNFKRVLRGIRTD